MKQLFVFSLLLYFVNFESEAQVSRYLIKLKDKGGSPFSIGSPQAYLSQRAIDRRTRYSISIDSTDLPVTPNYVSQISGVANVTIINVSKWLNSVSIQTTDPSAVTTISGFSFVQSIDQLALRTSQERNSFNQKNQPEETDFAPWSLRPSGIDANYFNYGSNSLDEIHLHNGEFLHNIGLRGQGMQVAMLDDGFNNYTAFSAFDSINANSQVLGTWDFVAREPTVINDGNHGMSCFSTIGANIPGQYVGMAPKANFWLFRTEDDASEYPIEEHNWSCGAERADSSGADIISTSLGYTTFDSPLGASSHTYSDMNGNTTMASIAADLAAKKGLLVFAANGNDGSNSWHYLSAPADGDSVIAVGAVNTSAVVAGFSSYGPSSDGRIKPDVASVGSNALIENAAGNVAFSNGTSFACPKMAGLGTCLWQGFPEYNNIKILHAIQASGNIASTPDDRTGYGIPDMKKAFGILLVEFATSSASVSACSATINWNSKDVDAMKYEIERKAVGDADYSKIGELSPQTGSVLANHQYVYTDDLTGVADGQVSYRIRQIIDADPLSLTAYYIDTANVALSGCANATPVTEFIRVSPNPSASQVSLIVQTASAISQMTISIYDMKGSLVQRLFNSKGPGRALIDLPTATLSRGKYIVKVNDGSKELGVTSLLRL